METHGTPTMTREEAKNAMKENKVSHRLFLPDEYVFAFNDFAVFTEENYSIDSETFWNDRSGKQWDDGWFIVPEKEDDTKPRNLFSGWPQKELKKFIHLMILGISETKYIDSHSEYANLKQQAEEALNELPKKD